MLSFAKGQESKTYRSVCCAGLLKMETASKSVKTIYTHHAHFIHIYSSVNPGCGKVNLQQTLKNIKKKKKKKERKKGEEEETGEEEEGERKEGRKRSIPFVFVRPCCISLQPLEQIQTNVSTMQKLFCSFVLVRKVSSVISLQLDRDAGENIGRICKKSMLTLLIIKGSRKLLKQ